MRISLFLVGILLFPSLVLAEAPGTGLQISGAGDLVGTFGNDKNRFEPREAEILLYSPIDQTFDGLINVAAHLEDGEYHFDVHELYIGSSRLIPRTRFRVGQFFLAVGRLNQFHRHDWPFVTAPKVHEEFFEEEGVMDSGLEVGYLLPTSFYLDLTVGVTNGWTFGHSHNVGNKPYFPTHYARLATYTDLFGNGGMQLGLNYLGRREGPPSVTNTTLLGIDLTAKWREAQRLKYFLQSEFWLRFESPRGAETQKTFGFYLYPQYGISSNWYAGMRLDGYTILNYRLGGSGATASNFDWAVVPTLAYKASEFSTLRAAYNFKGSQLQGREISHDRIFELQAVFLLGSHPAHDF